MTDYTKSNKENKKQPDKGVEEVKEENVEEVEEIEEVTLEKPLEVNYVNCELLNVRSGPGLIHSILTTLEQGVVLDVEEVLDGWFKIKLKLPKINASFGYVKASFVKTTKED